jgi:hypothetical protein
VDEKYFLSEKAMQGIIKNIDCENNLVEVQRERERESNTSDDRCKLLQGNEQPKKNDKCCRTIRSGGRGSTTEKHRWDLVYDE